MTKEVSPIFLDNVLCEKLREALNIITNICLLLACQSTMTSLDYLEYSLREKVACHGLQGDGESSVLSNLF